MSKEFKSADDIDPKYAKDFSEEGFWDKITGVIKSAGLEVIYKALQLYYAMCRPDCPIYIKGVIVAALGYFILPIDLIPDFIPVVGFSDDLAAIGVALVTANAYVDEEVKRQARAKIDDLFGAGTSRELEDDDVSAEGSGTVYEARIVEEVKELPAGVKSESSDRLAAMEELKKWKELLDMGAITQAEFDEKKREILSRL